MNTFNSISDVWAFLDTIPMFQKSGKSAANFSLDNITAFCRQLGNPQKKYPCVHVAGTNGKGTTCYLLEKVYNDAGYKTGVFTSPHLLRYNERIRVGGQEITDEKLVEFFQSTEKLFKTIKLSYFEISTALAFWYFADQEVDIAIIETGLGGRLDATNVITPEVSVITSIGLDHQNVLGNSLEEIAGEKAGIIKKGIPVVVGNISGDSYSIIEKVALQKDSKIYLAEDLKPEWHASSIELKNGEIQINSHFRESVNKWNTACVWHVVEVLQRQFPIEKKNFIQSVEAYKGAPARFEKIHSRYEWYFSGSHNAQAMESSVQAIQEIKPLFETVLVFSAMKDKLNTELFESLKGFKKAYFVEQKGERAAKFSKVKNNMEVLLLDETNHKIILNELQTELVIFMGSFYFYPIVKRWMSNIPF